MQKDPILNPLGIGNHYFPGIWRYLFPNSFSAFQLPKETQSSCMDCPRIRTDGYRTDYRCCTYFPRVPNYLVGLALIEGSAVQVIENLLSEGYLLPDGMVATPQKWELYLRDVAEDRFGKSTDILCPFLKKESGLCGIYPFRNGVCSTFFCISDHGSKGDSLWGEVHKVASQTELALGQWCMQQLGFDRQAYFRHFDGLAADVRSVAREDTLGWKKNILKRLWGKHYGRELEFFRSCGELVREHRDRLWVLANETEIYESNPFEKAAHKMVPRKYRDDDVDFDDGETLPPMQMWRDCAKAHGKLWTLPGDFLQVSERVRVVKNGGRDDEEKKFHSQPYVVEFLKRKGGKDWEWRRFIDEKTYKLLERFRRPRRADFALLNEWANESGSQDDPTHEVMQWVNLKVLTKAH